MRSKKVIVIGSGVAGLATAIRLASQGFSVSVYEKNNYAGGKIAAFKKDNYSFDSGPSLFTQPQNIEELFTLADVSIEKYCTYQPLTTTCNYFYENGKKIIAYADPLQFANELQEKTGEPTVNTLNYLKDAEKLYTDIGSIFLDHSLHKRKTWLHKRIIKAISAIKYPYLFQSLHKYNSNKFSSPEAIQLFDRFATYNGSDPYQAPAMLSLIAHVEQNQGIFYPQGGMINIANALYQLAKLKGVQFHFNSPVQEILYDEGNVTGIIVDGKIINADIVVSNADVYFTYKNLLHDSSAANKILQQERSSSAVIFYWGIKKEFAQLQLHNIFFSGDYKKEFENIFHTKQLSNDPTVYVNITSKMKSIHTPAGKENWFVMINAPANVGQDWQKLKQDLRKNVIDKLSRLLGEDIGSLIETEHIADPVMIEDQTASYMGSLYGTSSNSKLAAFFRKPNFTNTIKGLYFCGGSVHPGGGIPLCLKSAKIASDLIQHDHPKNK
jgi:phytoene desaturase